MRDGVEGEGMSRLGAWRSERSRGRGSREEREGEEEEEEEDRTHCASARTRCELLDELGESAERV